LEERENGTGQNFFVKKEHPKVLSIMDNDKSF
jgi:uncharacterized protein with WD repeat